MESVASFSPLWTGVADETQAKATRENLNLFEYNFGIATCNKGVRNNIYQWDSPNGWPPMHYIVISALDRYGYAIDAKRVADKYLDLITKNYIETGSLWEKYNVEDGSINVSDEYEMPQMMGWTAGVFIFAKEYMEK